MSATDYHLNFATDSWMVLLRDQVALLKHPGTHHRRLIEEAHSLHRARQIDPGELADLLEQADGALAYAVEALLDEPNDE